MAERPVEHALFRFLDLLERQGVPYMLMGSLASRVWGLPRAVSDLDLTLDTEDGGPLAALCAAAEREGFYVPETARQGYADRIQGMRRVTLQDVSGDARIPVVCYLVASAYQRAAFERRRKAEVGGREVWMISPEDLILHGLLVGSVRALSDIDDILLVQGSVDRAHLRAWAGELGVSDLLEERLPPE